MVTGILQTDSLIIAYHSLFFFCAGSNSEYFSREVTNKQVVILYLYSHPMYMQCLNCLLLDKAQMHILTMHISREWSIAIFSFSLNIQSLTLTSKWLLSGCG